MAKRGRPRHPDILTPREWEVLALLREGRSNEEIAQRLHISLAGAKYHVSEILSKLGVSSREEAARWEPQARPWWAAVAAPLASLRRAVSTSWLAALAAGVAVAVVGAAIGLLVWGLVRTGSGGDSAASLTVPEALSPPASVTNDPLASIGTFVLDEDMNSAERIGPPGTIAPDGSAVAVRADDGRGLFVFALQEGAPVLVFDGQPGAAAWSPDGQWLAIEAIDRDEPHVAVAKADGAGYLRLLDGSGSFEWSPDSTRLAILQQQRETTSGETSIAYALTIMDISGREVVRRDLGEYSVLDSPARAGVAWSPSGRQVAWGWLAPGDTARMGDECTQA
jgi:DNA-binding CsgD family transcriptional regulator